MEAINYFIILAFLATVIALMFGGVSMVRGGKFDYQHAIELMEGRLILHAITIGLIVIAVLVW